ncbi:hypothetical protein AB0C84_06975 [Actinomadura sp. NPDC048955]|uniref:Ribosomal protein L37AE/L43A n=1 Tax=Actinomadura luteofluorescens TaxID=46163 RepID=A0A7Y9ELI0_9ACTN|nr:MULTISPECIES: hypothetical protein [Actinomadura]MCR3739789.1 hypothetical protein [Actinomadura glauciflava]NUS56681.1 hypothetical protein [Streptomycetaceae bacterium]NYD49978.1 ribosomal protein L37AE/L43A [Actinomadura luteofluorescens]
MSSAVRRTWRRLVQSYNHLCAREDGATRGVTIPSGVWACDRCHAPHLELATLKHHLRTEHA